MISVSFRFYAELNDFLPQDRRQDEFTQAVDWHTSIKHAIESLGVPHTEVDLILVNGNPVDFSYLLEEDDRVSVYPVFESMDIQSASPLRPEPLRETRFILDTHLGKLAAYMRMLGFDTLYQNNRSDEALANISSRENRILLTRDRGLLKRKIVTRGYILRSSDPKEQVVEVLRRLDLLSQIAPFSRCLCCNQLLMPVEKEEIIDQLQPDTIATQNEFLLCTNCGRLYWKGSHYNRMQAMIAKFIASASLP